MDYGSSLLPSSDSIMFSSSGGEISEGLLCLFSSSISDSKCFGYDLAILDEVWSSPGGRSWLEEEPPMLPVLPKALWNFKVLLRFEKPGGPFLVMFEE
jgi:hypothetical protein